MKTTPTTSEGFTDTLPTKHEKQEKSPVAKENDALAEVDHGDDDASLHRKEDSTQGDEGVD